MSEKSRSQRVPDPDELWNILVETVHALPMYNKHKRYVAEVMLKEKSEMAAKELAIVINITLGEALVILTEIRRDQSNPADTVKTASPVDRSLLEYSN